MDGARRYIEQRVREFQPKPWWGPVTDAVGRAAGLMNEVAAAPDGHMIPYFSTGPGGAGLLLRAAFENYDAFVLAKHVVASRIYADRPIPAELRDFAALALTGGFPVPKKDRTAKKRNNWERDVFLHLLATEVCHNFGVARFGNRSPGSDALPSATQMIEDACDAKRNPTVSPYLRHLTKAMITEAADSKRLRRDLQEAASAVGPWLSGQLERTFADPWGDLP